MSSAPLGTDEQDLFEADTGDESAQSVDPGAQALEVPSADRVEQEAEVAPDHVERQAFEEADWEADPVDSAEQHIEVPIDEDEWR